MGNTETIAEARIGLLFIIGWKWTRQKGAKEIGEEGADITHNKASPLNKASESMQGSDQGWVEDKYYGCLTWDGVFITVTFTDSN